MMTLRTPVERFENLPDYPFAPNYADVPDGDGGELRIHYVDEGPADAETILLIHGQPTWSYLYRHMIPPLADAGFRVVAPDLVGFGRSDKPTEAGDYTYANHVRWMSDWLMQLDLDQITLFCQDWGGLIGLRLVTAFPERFARVVAANTGLPTGPIPDAMTESLRTAYSTLPVVDVDELEARFEDTSGIPGFLYWRKFCAETPELWPGDVVGSLRSPDKAGDVRRAYDAPFPDQTFVTGARRFPQLVPIFADEPEVPENLAAWEVLKRFDKPFLTAFSDGDPVTRGGEAAFQSQVPGCQGLEHPTIAGAGHFLQEDQPAACVDAILALIRSSG